MESDLPQKGVYGVPQGPLSGPILFLLYLNDIKAVTENPSCHLYANDSILIQSASDPKNLIKC